MNTAAAVRTELCAEVAVPLPVQDPFSYRVPPELSERLQAGMRVRVPFKNRDLVGYAVEVRSVEVPEEKKLKSVLEVLDDQPVLSAPLLALTRWIGGYYGSSWGEAIENALPKWVKHGKRAQRALKKKGALAESGGGRAREFTLSPDQGAALQAIEGALASDLPKPVLLYGVTGSGKSELYIRTIQKVLAKGRTAICLVPEIALTEQLKRFFQQHFGDRLEILHSKMNDTERFLAWHRLRSGETQVALGPRSAVFAPVPDLGLIVIDEEHEGSYKQETSPRYHARDVALWRAKAEGALLLLGSATPSLESMHLANQNKITRLELKTRIDEKPMPKVQIVDLKNAGGPGRRPGILSLRLIQEIEANLRAKEGTMLLLNRRGFSTHITCPRCGQAESCSSCQVSLTYHQDEGFLLCHYCNFVKPVSSACSNCKSPVLRFAGFGTEKVESEIARLFPAARIGRLDADTVRKKGSHEGILREFRDRRQDILIGTQMIAKGFDFPHVTLVGVVLADVGLMLPDFRSAERTFQLLTQVAGRAGRGEKPGRVIVQTFSPDHPSVRLAKDHNYRQFFEHESRERFRYRYPPHVHLMNLILRSRDEKKVYPYAMEVRDQFRRRWPASEEAWKPLEILGPAPLPFYRLRGHFRWHLMLKFPPGLIRASEVAAVLAQVKRPSLVQTALDVDPLSIL